MATLNRMHDLTPFVDKHSSRYALGGLQYLASVKRIFATDGRIMVCAPVEGNHCADVLLPAERITHALKIAEMKHKLLPRFEQKKSAPSVELQTTEDGKPTLAGEATEPQEGRYRKVLDIFAFAGQPVVSIALDPKLLKAVCDHAIKTGATSIMLGVKNAESAMVFAYSPKDSIGDVCSPPCGGVLMPLCPDKHRTGHGIIDELLSIGKTAPVVAEPTAEPTEESAPVDPESMPEETAPVAEPSPEPVSEPSAEPEVIEFVQPPELIIVRRGSPVVAEPVESIPVAVESLAF